MTTRTTGRGGTDSLKHLTLALQPLTLADLPGQVLSMAWKAPGEFGFKRRASGDTPAKDEDRVRHHRDHVWTKRERFVNQILNGILLAAPPAALAAVAAELGAIAKLQAPTLHKLSIRKLGRYVGEPDFVLFDPATRSIVLGEIKIAVSPGNDRYSFEQYTKYMLLGALLRVAGLAERVAHLVIVPDSDPKAFCKDYKYWKPAVRNGFLDVSPNATPVVRRKDKTLYKDRISWVIYAVEFLSKPKIQRANGYGADAVALLGLEERSPALWPTTVVAWERLANVLGGACRTHGASQLVPSIAELRRMTSSTTGLGLTT